MWDQPPLDGRRERTPGRRMASKTALRGLLPLPDSTGSPRQWWLVFGALCLVAAASRLYDLQNPAWVAWDETHFGKFASWYINGTYFFDVHPALGKMMLAGAGHLSGYNGSFPFTRPGLRYNDTNYVGMRAFCASLGAAIVPMSFVTVHDLTDSLPAATYSALFLTMDVGMTTISRFILLDPILMFFMVAATMFNFKINKHRPFSFWWWLNLSLTGLALGCALSVKFVGVFTVALIGFYTVIDLWSIFCDLNHGLGHTLRHFIARVVCLILIPLATYLLVYCIHDTRQTKTNDPFGMNSDGWLSAGSQMRIVNNDMHNLTQPKFLAYGSVVTLQTVGAYSNYLHSHNITYPDWSHLKNVSAAFNLSEVRSVTGFRNKDANNFWRIQPHDEEEIPDWENPYVPAEPVLNGDTIRLVHNATGLLLAAYSQKAMVASTQMMVGAQSEKKLKSFQTEFVISAPDLVDEAPIEAINTTFQLYNPSLKCGVLATEDKLPDWAYHQNEITCSKRLRGEGALWTVHRNIHPRLRNVTKHWRKFRTNLMERFVESHRIIAAVNAKLKPSRQKMLSADHPWMWPVLYRGLHFSQDENHRLYLLGTAPIWWCALLFLFVSLGIMLYITYQTARHSRPHHLEPAGHTEDSRNGEWSRRYCAACFWLLLAWAANYAPFWMMCRILYFHHYFPPFCYSCMLSGVVLDYLLSCGYRQLPLSSRDGVFHWTVAVLIASLVYSFWLFSPLAYGMSGVRPKDSTNSSYYHLWWRPSWDL